MNKLLFIFLCLPLIARTQVPANLPTADSARYEVVLSGGSVHTGFIVELEYGYRLILRDDAGKRHRIQWSAIRHLDYIGPPQPRPPARRLADGWHLSVQQRTGLGAEQFVFGTFRERARLISLGLDAHLMWYRKRWALGPGMGFDLMDHARGEHYLSLTGRAEYRMGRRRARPYLRLEGGMGILTGSNNLGGITGRRPGLIVHPSLGLHLAPPRRGGRVALFTGVGYRFARAGLMQESPSFEETVTRINYRRLTVSLGATF